MVEKWKGEMVKNMKKIICAMVLTVGAMAFAAEQKYVDPNPFAGYGPAMKSTAEHPLAVNWSQQNDAAITAATTDEALAAVVADSASAAALLAKIKPAYATCPLVLTQIAAVTQWVMLPDPWYCLFWDGEHASGRKVWVAALESLKASTADAYIKTFCQQQLDLCR